MMMCVMIFLCVCVCVCVCVDRHIEKSASKDDDNTQINRPISPLKGIFD